MISFKQYIVELFEKPYNAKERENNLRPTDYGGNMGSQTFEAKTKDGDTLGIQFGHFSSKPSNAFPDGNYEITVEFWIRPSGGGRATMGITGKGDAGRIMATVLEITEEVIEEYDPTRLTFHADKFVNPAAKEKVESGRIGLYNAMVKRFAKKNGFSAKLPNPKTVERKGEATYHLNKIGTRVWDKTVTESSKQYITELTAIKKVDYDDAYWQPSKSSKVEIGTTVGRFKGRPRWKEVEKIFEKERPRNLPSRLGNIYIAATENNVLFEKSKPVYIVQMTGKAFYANLELFTDAINSFVAKDVDKVSELARQYWEGIGNNKPNKYTEIILDGEAEVSYKL